MTALAVQAPLCLLSAPGGEARWVMFLLQPAGEILSTFYTAPLRDPSRVESSYPQW